MHQGNEKNRIKNENYFCACLVRAGFNFATGVPCGVLKFIIDNLRNNEKIKHVNANKESEAIGIAAGAELAGKRAMIYMQNSGLMDSLNDITSLLMIYKIPALLIVSWRGAPGEDAPQHFINGRTMKKVLKDLNIPFWILKNNNIQKTVKTATARMEKTKQPAIILIKRGDLK